MENMMTRILNQIQHVIILQKTIETEMCKDSIKKEKNKNQVTQ
jgi:hypothetical protein